MQILNIIFTIVAIAANAALAFFAGYAFVCLRRMQRDVEDVKRHSFITCTLTLGNHVRDNFNELEKMKETFHHLVENEHYEEAERLKVTIEKAEAHAVKSLEKFKKAFGGVIDEVVLYDGNPGKE